MRVESREIMNILGRNENGCLAIQLAETKKGNVALDATEFEKVWRMPGQVEKDLVLFESEDQLVLKPYTGLVVQVDGELYRLVRVMRARKDSVDECLAETLTASQMMKNHFFEYAGLFAPSNKWVENMEIVWDGDSIV